VKRAIFYAILGAVAMILSYALITGPILETVAHGGPRWLAWFLFTPALQFGFGIVMAAKAEHDHYSARRAPTVPDWHVIDDELPDQLSETEREMERRFARHADDAMGLVVTPWPVNLGIVKPRGGDQ
jgi:hypothetical protein